MICIVIDVYDVQQSLNIFTLHRFKLTVGHLPVNNDAKDIESSNSHRKETLE